MADEDRQAKNSATGRVLEERMKHFARRLDSFDESLKDLTTQGAQILVDVRVLQTRVSYMAAGIGCAAGVASSLVVMLVKVVAG